MCEVPFEQFKWLRDIGVLKTNALISVNGEGKKSQIAVLHAQFVADLQSGILPLRILRACSKRYQFESTFALGLEPDRVNRLHNWSYALQSVYSGMKLEISLDEKRLIDEGDMSSMLHVLTLLHKSTRSLETQILRSNVEHREKLKPQPSEVEATVLNRKKDGAAGVPAPQQQQPIRLQGGKATRRLLPPIQENNVGGLQPPLKQLPLVTSPPPLTKQHGGVTDTGVPSAVDNNNPFNVNVKVDERWQRACDVARLSRWTPESLDTLYTELLNQVARLHIALTIVQPPYDPATPSDSNSSTLQDSRKGISSLDHYTVEDIVNIVKIQALARGRVTRHAVKAIRRLQRMRGGDEPDGTNIPMHISGRRAQQNRRHYHAKLKPLHSYTADDVADIVIIQSLTRGKIARRRANALRVIQRRKLGYAEPTPADQSLAPRKKSKRHKLKGLSEYGSAKDEMAIRVIQMLQRGRIGHLCVVAIYRMQRLVEYHRVTGGHRKGQGVQAYCRKERVRAMLLYKKSCQHVNERREQCMRARLLYLNDSSHRKKYIRIQCLARCFLARRNVKRRRQYKQAVAFLKKLQTEGDVELTRKRVIKAQCAVRKRLAKVRVRKLRKMKYTPWVQQFFRCALSYRRVQGRVQRITSTMLRILGDTKLLRQVVTCQNAYRRCVARKAMRTRRQKVLEYIEHSIAEEEKKEQRQQPPPPAPNEPAWQF